MRLCQRVCSCLSGSMCGTRSACLCISYIMRVLSSCGCLPVSVFRVGWRFLCARSICVYVCIFPKCSEYNPPTPRLPPLLSPLLLPVSMVTTICLDQEEELKDAILLVFANKQDQPGSLTSTEVRPVFSHTVITGKTPSEICSGSCKWQILLLRTNSK